VAKLDTILGHCLIRAAIADAGGADAAVEKYPAGAVGGRHRWVALRVMAKVTPRASRVAAFISMWGVALYDLGVDEISVDEFAEWANESRATAFRRASEYRELWPDVEINELGRLVRDHVRKDRVVQRNPYKLMSLAVSV
jgi:hypothetical protein